MSTNLMGLLKGFLWFVCAFHIVVGVGLNVSDAFPQLVADYYGATVAWTPALEYIVKPIGAFMLAIGIAAGFAARDPLHHGSVIYAVVALFAMRALQRLVFQAEIADALGIGAGRNITNAAFFFVMAAALYMLFRLVSRGPEKAA